MRKCQIYHLFSNNLILEQIFIKITNYNTFDVEFREFSLIITTTNRDNVDSDHLMKITSSMLQYKQFFKYSICFYLFKNI